MRLDLTALAFGGLVLGALVPLPASVQGTTPTSVDGLPAVSQEHRAPAHPDCPSPPPVDEAAVAALTIRMKALTEDLQALEAKRIEREGLSAPWPDPLAPAAFRARMEQAVAALPGVTLVAMDCEEPPCVASLLRRRGLDELDVVSDPYEPVHDAFAASGLPTSTTAPVDRAGEPWEVHTVAFVPEHEGEALHRRARFRVGLLHEAQAAWPDAP